MNRIGIIILVIASYLISFCCLAKEEVMDVYGNGDLPPITYLENGRMQGLGYELTKAILFEAGIPSRINFVPWARAYYRGKKGTGMIFGIYKTAEREMIFDYSAELWTESVLLVTAKGKEFYFNSIDDLKGRIIVMQQGTAPSNQFVKYLEDGALNVVFNRSPQTRLKFLLAGRADVGIFNPGLQAVEMNVLAAGLSMDQFSVLPMPLAVSKKYIAIKKSETSKQTISDINEAIERLHKNGQIDKIKTKYNIKA
ncbi:transporter substrate-binding domain-containing protein [Shewanella sp. BF02_Schw]|uniref:substrate-binding periplasmic protein n=1 Tax=Shewanella sp. BF02_Schw TaxID=394908 RepID=UPI001785C187|nr:transporter substrate-binding domain-containing protein [Shewanella sp. BF02_Schw]MBO1897623.1 transporter substrate-binding domain-containing protein [Shewanella sp. BF02_Schw]